MTEQAEIGVFGGSGFYSLLDDVREVKVDTPYGPPSDSFFLADGRRSPGRVPAAPRPAPHDPAPPDQLPGQRLGDALARASRPSSARAPPARSSSTCEPGRLRRLRPVRGPDHRREPTPSSTARSSPTSPRPRSTTRSCAAIAIDVIREHGITVHDGGTVVVIQGPRFSTKAESKWFSDAGWEVINMTQYPEAYLCRELGMAVVNIAPHHRLRRRRPRGHRGGRPPHERARGVRAERRADPQGRPRHDRALPGRPRRARRPRGARAAPGATATRSRRRTSGSSRPGSRARRRRAGGSGAALPIGVALGSIGAERALVARERPAARRGRLRGRLGWDHFIGPGRPDASRSSRLDDPRRGRGARTGRVRSARSSLNVMNRHPGRPRPDGGHAPGGERRAARRSGSGSAGTPPSTRPTASPSRRRPSGSPGSRRPSRSSGPCGPAARSAGRRRSTRCDAGASPGRPPPPADHRRRRDAGRAPGWRPDRRRLDGLRPRRSSASLPIYLEALAEAGRRTRADQPVLVGFQGGWLGRRRPRPGAPGSTRRARRWPRWRRPGRTG